MTLWELLYQASLCQWVGILLLAFIAAAGLSGLFRITLRRGR